MAGLPEGSYAKAAKSLQTSGLSVAERIEVAEALLACSAELTPRPDALVRQHVVYALSCKKKEFDDYRARYWRLLSALHKRASTATPEPIAAAATEALRRSGTERHECVNALDGLLASDSLRARLEVLGALAGAALDAARVDASPQLRRVALALLVTHDDTQRNSVPAKLVFSVCLTSLVYPILRSSGVLREAGEIVLRRGLFPHVADVLQTKQATYYKGLYAVLSDVRSCPHPSVLPELLAFLLRECRDAAHKRRTAEFPKSGMKRKASEIIDHATSAVSASTSTLPTEVIISLRFFKDLLFALMKNLDMKEPELEYSLPALEMLIFTAAELEIYRPSYEASFARPSKSARNETNAKTPRVNKEKEVSVSSIISKLLSFVSGKLETLSGEARSESSGLTRVPLVMKLADCGKAIVRLAKDSIHGDLPDFLECVLRCAGKEGSGGPCSSLAGVLCEVFREYTLTRKVPELFQMLVHPDRASVVLDNFHVLMSESSLRETIIESIMGLPTGHAESCVRALTNSGSCFRSEAAGSVFYLLSVIVEVVDLSSLKTIIPILAKAIAEKIDPNTTKLPIRCGLSFLYASITSTFARNSIGPSSQLYTSFASSSGLENFEVLNDKQQNKNVTEICIRMCELRMLSGLVHFQIIDCSGADDRAAASKVMGEVLRKFAQLPDRKELSGDEISSRKSNLLSTQWQHLLLGKEQSWIPQLLKIISSLSPLVDYLALDCEPLKADSIVELGIKKLVSLAMTDVPPIDVFWDDVLETQFARKFSYSCVSSMLKPSSGEFENMAALELIPKLNDSVFSAKQKQKVSSLCDTLSATKSKAAHIQASAQRASSCLQNQSTTVVCFDVGKANSFITVSLAFMLRTNDALCKGTDVSSRENRAHDAAEKVLANILAVGPLQGCCQKYRETFARLAVVACDRALYCSNAQLSTYLQLLSALGRDISDEGIVGICEVLDNRLKGLVQQTRKDSNAVLPQCLDRIVRVSTALSLGLCDGSISNIDWTDPQGGIARCTERATRGSTSNCANGESLFSLATHAVQAVAAMLWMASREKKYSNSGNGTRGEMFNDDYERRVAVAQVWKISEWAVAMSGLAAARGSAVTQERNEMLLLALCELLHFGNIRSDSSNINVRARVQRSAVRAACLLARRTTLTLAALRCVRAVMRSGLMDEQCARIISRFFEKVSGASTVSALADTASALIAVSDASVRGALEHGAAALIRQLRERGRSEALRACSDDAREVLRALMETYRQDFEYGRS